MAIARMEIVIPAIGADGSYCQLYLEDCYNVNQQEWDVGETIASTDSQGAEWQLWVSLLAMTHAMWLRKRFGLLAPTEGDAMGGDESGTIDFGTPV